MARPRKATKLKVYEGNRGGHKLPENERTPSGAGIKPDWLTGPAAKIWDQYALELVRMGLLSARDSHNFAVWCQLAAQFARDRCKMSPALISQMRQLGAAFGMDPASRSRIQVPVSKQEKADFEEFLKKKG